jgi:hypothetical protein
MIMVLHQLVVQVMVAMILVMVVTMVAKEGFISNVIC